METKKKPLTHTIQTDTNNVENQIDLVWTHHLCMDIPIEQNSNATVCTMLRVIKTNRLWLALTRSDGYLLKVDDLLIYLNLPAKEEHLKDENKFYWIKV